MLQSPRPRRIRLLFVAGLFVTILPLVASLLAQGAAQTPASREVINKPTDPQLQGFRWRSIGPVGQGGRVDDFAVDEKNPSTYYIGYAVGGVWKTTNNGTTFEPVFDTYGASSIADLALAPSDPNILWVATGEANNRQTTSYGNGLWKSTDAGKSFTDVGFKDAQTLGRIVIHPKDPNIVWIAVGGHLFGPNAERGVFMTSDGGKTWNKTLYIDENTGATELVIDPSNPNVLFAAMYQRRRAAWGFVGGGPGSGIHQSTDGGKTWKKVTGGGLPSGTMGRIALDFSRSSPNVIYAQIEVAPDSAAPAPAPTPSPAPATGGATPTAAAGGGAGGGGGGGACGTTQANPPGNGIWRSADKGKTWTYVNSQNQRPMYFSQIRVDPTNADIIYVGGVPPCKSIDGGKTFQGLNNMGHVDNHAIWIDPLNHNHVMYGNDGGVDVSWDGGATWESPRLQAVGLAYHVSADMRHPYWVCTGLQDNGSWCGPSSTRSGGIHMWNWISVGGGDGFQNQIDPNDPTIFYTESQNAGIQRYNLTTGQNTSIQPRTSGAGRGFGGGGGGGRAGGAGPAAAPAGGAGAAGAATGRATGATPTPAAETAPPQPPAAGFGGFGGGRSNIISEIPPNTLTAFNWNSPIRLSPHNPTTMYLGGRQLFISRDRGDTWTMTKEMGKGIDLSQRNLMGISYGLLSCSFGRGGGFGGAGATAATPAEGGAAGAGAAAGGGGRGRGGAGRGGAAAPAAGGGGAAGGSGQPCILSKNDGLTTYEFGTMTELAESPVLPGVLWTGTDDGNVNLSRDGGYTWAEVGKNIPGVNHEYYVSGLEASWSDAGTAYAALDGHRNDDLKPYIFKTTDYGQTWKSVSGNLPPVGHVNSIRQDPVNPNLLFAPTELGFYVSLNDGQSWSLFSSGLPLGRVDEVVVHPREHDLILGTHSRSVWIMDDISALEQLTPQTMERDAVLFKPRDAVLWKQDRKNVTEVPGDKWWEGEIAPPGTAITYYLKSAGSDAKFTVSNATTGQVLRSCNGTTQSGINRWQWGLVTDQQLQTALAGGRGGGGFGGAGGGTPPDVSSCSIGVGRGGGGGGGRGGGGAGAIGPGVYKVTLTMGGREVATQTFNILEDIWLNEK